MTLPQAVKRFTPGEYYRLERDALSRNEYYKGEIFAMAGGTATHSLICNNVSGEARARLKGGPCTVYESNLRLKVKATGLRTYPDVSIYCEPLEADDEDPYSETYTNPTVLFEVLSKSTEAYDRGAKPENYRKIESLRAYALISQYAPHVELYERQPSGNWLFREFLGLDATVTISSPALDLPMAEIYARVHFQNDDADTGNAPSRPARNGSTGPEIAHQ